MAEYRGLGEGATHVAGNRVIIENQVYDDSDPAIKQLVKDFPMFFEKIDAAPSKRARKAKAST